ncbi:cupin domain-containing protein [Rhizobium sp. BK060]|uniref:cupin domain-containing protein n=1 Tax=Rhizobium sp. BK060 TaxID=2587096 RepID=UPI001612295D|nr:cupin domain-containing protein [Rhizobium sp. BK060]MBB3396013.1 quercetin dioxygenase-like cupin family protein [Rhizobium sp. BK060]
MADQVAAKPELIVPAPGEYVFDLSKGDAIAAGPGYTSAAGRVVKGDRMMVGLMRLAAGQATETHSHPNEQWTFVVEGIFLAEIGDEKFAVGPGSVVYQPANILHGGKAGPDSDLVFFTVKDNSHGLYGTRA